MTRTALDQDVDEYIRFMRRIVRAAGQHVGQADPEQLAQLIAARAELDLAIAAAVRGLRDSGATWADIGAATGTSRQAAFEKWAEAARVP